MLVTQPWMVTPQHPLATGSLPFVLLCGWRTLLKAWFETASDQILKLAWHYQLKSVVPICDS